MLIEPPGQTFRRPRLEGEDLSSLGEICALPNVASLLGTMTVDGREELVFENWPRLKDFRESSSFDPVQVPGWMAAIALAVHRLHVRGLAHGDISLDTVVMVTGDGDAQPLLQFRRAPVVIEDSATGGSSIQADLRALGDTSRAAIAGTDHAQKVDTELWPRVAGVIEQAQRGELASAAHFAEVLATAAADDRRGPIEVDDDTAVSPETHEEVVEERNALSRDLGRSMRTSLALGLALVGSLILTGLLASALRASNSGADLDDDGTTDGDEAAAVCVRWPGPQSNGGCPEIPTDPDCQVSERSVRIDYDRGDGSAQDRFLSNPCSGTWGVSLARGAVEIVLRSGDDRAVGLAGADGSTAFLGYFDGDDIVDVIRPDANGQWAMSAGAVGPWVSQGFTTTGTTDIADLAAVDVDGDGTTDLCSRSNRSYAPGALGQMQLIPAGGDC